MRADDPATGNAFSWRFVTPMLLGSALNPVNSSVIATALVPIAAALHVPVGRTAILVSVLYLATAIAQPTAGKLAEELGPRRVFLAGIATVLAGGLLGGLAQDLPELMVARVLIGVGTSAGYPSAMVAIRRRSDQAGLDAPPGSVLGALVIAGMVTAVIGLPIGGVLVEAWGWRTTFLINVPVTLVTLVMAIAWIPRDPRAATRRTAREVAARIDVAGIAAFGATIAALLVFLLSLPHPDWVALAVAVVAGGALGAWELRAGRPFLDVRMLASNGALTRTYLRYAVTLLCIYTVFYGLTQWIEAGRGLSAMAAGLVLLPMSVLSGLIARPVSQRNLLRTPLILTAVSLLAGSAGILLLTQHTPVVWIVVVTLIFGVTMGAGTSANQTALYAQAPAVDIGTASGLLRSFGYIGSIASSAIIAIVFRTHVSDHGLHVTAIVMIAVSVVALLLTLADRQLMSLASTRRQPPAPHAPDQVTGGIRPAAVPELKSGRRQQGRDDSSLGGPSVWA
ncbi:MAG TPA: MFS transporter [Trebonia sp.]|nr:MFS transporter [Trebonia sp.]